MQYRIKKQADGTWRAVMDLPAGDGSISAVANGLSAAEATVKAARGVTAAARGTRAGPSVAKKAATVALLAKVAANPAIKAALLSGGIEAAKMAAAVIPGGAVALRAFDLISKSGVAKSIFRGFLRLRK